MAEDVGVVSALSAGGEFNVSRIGFADLSAGRKTRLAVWLILNGVLLVVVIVGLSLVLLPGVSSVR